MTKLRQVQNRPPGTVHSYIEPQIIEDKIREIEESRSAFLPSDTTVLPAGASMLHKAVRADGKVDCFAIFDTIQPLTPKQTQMLADLKGRLELSRAYAKKLDSVKRGLGLPSLERGEDKVITAINRIERQILKLPARSADDTKIKLKLYARERNDFGGNVSNVADSLVRDLGHMLQQQTASA